MICTLNKLVCNGTRHLSLFIFDLSPLGLRNVASKNLLSNVHMADSGVLICLLSFDDDKEIMSVIDDVNGLQVSRARHRCRKYGPN